MVESTPFYCGLLDTNKAAFERTQYLVAYHALTAAMYCAVGAKDVLKLKEVLFIASGQLEEVIERSGNVAFPHEPVEVSLYRSLVQLARTRLLLFERA